MKSFLEFQKLDEVNHREHAQGGKVHPSMAKHMSVGQEHDFYHPKTGDKISGVVKHKSDKEVHLQANKDGKVGGGDTHKFSIAEETAPWETDAEAKKREKSAFKKPNNPNRTGMDSARALAMRGLTAAKKKQNEEVEQIQEREDDEYHTPSKHHVHVTISKGNGPKEHRKATITAKEPDHAVNTALRHYKSQGYTVHDHKYLGEQSPVAPTLDRKYIKGTPENLALKASRKPINGHPTAQAKTDDSLRAYYASKKKTNEEVEQIDELSDTTLSNYVTAARKDREHNKVNKASPDTAQKVNANARDKKRIAGMNKANSYLTPGTAGHNKNQARRAANEEVEKIEEATVKTQKYSWGTMKTIHHGSSFSIPLHPEHHEPIAKMKDQQQHTIKTEDGKQYHVKREGDTVHFHGVNGGNKTSVPHKSLAEETKKCDDCGYVHTGKCEMEEALVGGQKELDKNKNGKLDKKDFELLRKKKTLKEFVQDLLEYETDKNGRYVHTKGSYGKSYNSETDDHDDDNKPKSTEKRGRGRPAGSKSGARQQNTGKSYGGIQTHSLNLPNTNK